jgi:chromosome segregation ATPase
LASVTWRDLADVLERISRVEERVDRLNEEIGSLSRSLTKLEDRIDTLAANILEMRESLNNNMAFYRKLAFRVIVTIIAAVATALATLLVRFFG